MTIAFLIGIIVALITNALMGPSRRGEALFLSMFLTMCIITALSLIGAF